MQNTPTLTERDTDGDGVVNSQDYAPRDPSVQRADQVQKETATPTEEFDRIVGNIRQNERNLRKIGDKLRFEKSITREDAKRIRTETVRLTQRIRKLRDRGHKVRPVVEDNRVLLVIESPTAVIFLSGSAVLLYMGTLLAIQTSLTAVQSYRLVTLLGRGLLTITDLLTTFGNQILLAIIRNQLLRKKIQNFSDAKDLADIVTDTIAEYLDSHPELKDDFPDDIYRALSEPSPQTPPLTANKRKTPGTDAKTELVTDGFEGGDIGEWILDGDNYGTLTAERDNSMVGSWVASLAADGSGSKEVLRAYRDFDGTLAAGMTLHSWVSFTHDDSHIPKIRYVNSTEPRNYFHLRFDPPVDDVWFHVGRGDTTNRDNFANVGSTHTVYRAAYSLNEDSVTCELMNSAGRQLTATTVDHPPGFTYSAIDRVVINSQDETPIDIHFDEITYPTT